MEIKQKILFLALSILSCNAYSMKNELVCIDYSGSLQFVNESKDKEINIGTIKIIDKWEYKILKSKWMDKEHRFLKIIIRARLISFFEQKEVISNYVFNVSTRQIIFEQEFSNGINMIKIGGDKSIYKEVYSQKWYEILTTRITKCLGDYYYYERGDLFRPKFN